MIHLLCFYTINEKRPDRPYRGVKTQETRYILISSSSTACTGVGSQACRCVRCTSVSRYIDEMILSRFYGQMQIFVATKKRRFGRSFASGVGGSRTHTPLGKSF